MWHMFEPKDTIPMWKEKKKHVYYIFCFFPNIEINIDFVKENCVGTQNH
jgi:hypothetical protein